MAIVIDGDTGSLITAVGEITNFGDSLFTQLEFEGML